MTQSDAHAPITTFYNGRCPVCRAEIAHYRARALRFDRPLRWVDVAEDSRALAVHNVPVEDQFRRLHVLTASGALLSGVDAFIAIWRRLPGWQWLARLAAFGPVKIVAHALYEGVLAPILFHWNKRQGRIVRAGAGRPRDGKCR